MTNFTVDEKSILERKRDSYKTPCIFHTMLAL